jgi:cytochrome c-type biogenesis protein CcmH
MIAFAVVALALLAAALAVVLWPLLRRPAAPALAREQSNLDIHRDQFAELARDVEAGALGAERYEQARDELHRRVLEEAAAPAPVRNPAAPGKLAPVLIAFFVPLTAIVLYFHLGNLAGLVAPRHPAADLSSITADEFKDMTAKLAARMQQNPGDAEGWTMLGRAYRAMDRFPEANAALKKAVELRPQDADLLADYAESLALAAGRSLAGEPTRLLERALKLDPRSSKVLTLSGSAAFERKDYRAALGFWGAVLKQPDVSPELAQALQKGMDEAKARQAGKSALALAAEQPGTGKERVTGSVKLDAALRAKVRADDTVFVFARAADGPRMPLAIAKIKVADLPYQFSFDDSSAMMPDMKLSRFPEVVIGARVSKSGGATPVAGDLEGASAKVKPGRTGVVVTIDRVVAGS